MLLPDRGPPGPPLVILSAAKDLMPIASGDGVLSFGFAQDRRCAQDDKIERTGGPLGWTVRQASSGELDAERLQAGRDVLGEQSYLAQVADQAVKSTYDQKLAKAPATEK